MKETPERLEYVRRRKARRKEILVELLGGICVSCGTTEDLQFDHIDPSTKNFKITEYLFSPRVFEEIKKCQLLCRSCHHKKTGQERTQQAKVRTHCYSGKHEWTEANIHIDPDGNLRCRICKKEWRTRGKEETN